MEKHNHSHCSEDHDHDSQSGSEEEDNICHICCEYIEIFAITPCNHNTICGQCHYKMRIKENISCVMCKQENNAIVLSLDPDIYFDDLDLRKMNVSDKGSLYFLDKEVEEMFERLLQIRCAVHYCEKTFDSVVQYKNHLKREHKRFIW